MKYPLEKYRYYTHTLPDGTTETIAMSTYAGRIVKARAKCHPSDNYDAETGKKLAALRCNEKISAKRLSRAVICEREAKEAMEKAIQYYHDMVDYRTDAAIAWTNADDEMKAFIKEIKHI